MKLEDQVCSLELAKRLKELGVKQESYFYWISDEDENFVVPTGTYDWGDWPGYEKFEPKYSAFTVAELGEMLPTNKVQTLKWFDVYYCESWQDVVDKAGPIGRETSKKEADARAKMLIHLIEKGIVAPSGG